MSNNESERLIANFQISRFSNLKSSIIFILNNSSFTLISSPCSLLFTLRPLPFALCPSPFALCPLPFALRPSPFALCPSPFVLLFQMPHRLMTSYALNRLPLTTPSMRRIDHLHDFLMTAAAGRFRDLPIARGDLNWPFDFLEGKRHRVMIAVEPFGRVFADEIMRRVAIVAHRHGVMARFAPSIVLLAHDMAVDAGFGVIGQIRGPARIKKSKAAQGGRRARKNRQHHPSHGHLACESDPSHGSKT
jgi:hypothetical protein